jgi:hypothetical protein
MILEGSMMPASPTIAHLKGHGLEGLFATCHSVPFFKALG